MAQRLTDKFIQSLRPPDKGGAPDRYGDSDLPGFALFVYQSGRKVFKVQARFIDKETGRVIATQGNTALETASGTIIVTESENSAKKAQGKAAKRSKKRKPKIYDIY